MTKKNAQGAGTIRKKTVTRNGKQYTYWEARYTAGTDPGTGKQIQRSITGKTQKEVTQRLRAVTVTLDSGTYTEPSRWTVGQWLDIWAKTYLAGRKPATVNIYRGNIKNHIKPALGAVKLKALRPHMVQGFINGLDGLSPATVRLAYKILHAAVKKAVELGYLPKDFAAGVELPKLEQKEIFPLDDTQVKALLETVKGGYLEPFITVALFTGLRLSELLGLTWEAVDFSAGSLTVCRQLARPEFRSGGLFLSPKNGKPRTLSPAPAVMAALKKQHTRQLEQCMKAGPQWSSPHGLVFTDDLGGHIDQWRIEKAFVGLCDKAGLQGHRFHDLRHTYAVNAIRAGDDIKTIQGNLGHASAAFTLDRYGHFTDRMKQDSAARMENFIKDSLRL